MSARASRAMGGRSLPMAPRSKPEPWAAPMAGILGTQQAHRIAGTTTTRSRSAPGHRQGRAPRTRGRRASATVRSSTAAWTRRCSLGRRWWRRRWRPCTARRPRLHPPRRCHHRGERQRGGMCVRPGPAAAALPPACRRRSGAGRRWIRLRWRLHHRWLLHVRDRQLRGHGLLEYAERGPTDQELARAAGVGAGPRRPRAARGRLELQRGQLPPPGACALPVTCVAPKANSSSQAAPPLACSGGTGCAAAAAATDDATGDALGGSLSRIVR